MISQEKSLIMDYNLNNLHENTVKISLKNQRTVNSKKVSRNQ